MTLRMRSATPGEARALTELHRYQNVVARMNCLRHNGPWV